MSLPAVPEQHKRIRNFMFVAYNHKDPTAHHNFGYADGDLSRPECLSDHITACDASGAFSFVKYMVTGEEICPRTGTPHLQGFIILKNPMSVKGLQEKLTRALRFPSTFAIKPADNNIDECIKYCCKGHEISLWSRMNSY